jgi:hypothetical protein
MNVAVVISTWSGAPPHRLLQLCESFKHHYPGYEYDLVLCANGSDYVLPGPVTDRFEKLFVRENTGYNLGAWDYAWRHLPNHDHFLFLQDDCVVRKNGWLRDFIGRFVSTRGCGLVGENIDRSWDIPWSQLCNPAPKGDPKKNAAARKRVEWAAFFREKLREWRIPEGQTARHVTTVVQFTSRTILEEVGGYNFGNSKLEATAGEVAFSRKIVARGNLLIQVGRWRHSRIAHPQWASNAPPARLWRSVKKRIPRSVKASS